MTADIATQAQQETVTFTVNGKTMQGRRGDSLLKVLLHEGYDIPHLCYHEAVTAYGSCRLCLVEVKKGRKTKVTTSCNYPLMDGIEVTTNSEKIRKHRKVVFELLLAQVPNSPELQSMAAQYGVTDTRFEKKYQDCILCGLCERVCREVVGVNALGFMGRGVEKDVGAPFKQPSKTCIGCGACVYVCPVNCIKEEQLPTKRTIVRWERNLPMQTCKRCGYPFAPTYQLLQMQKQTGLPWEFFELCPDCRDVKD
ncbi:MAG: (2Fe-2S)-binding protein [Deltaproteobacteria bacterium]|nr:(2Fe-2S)-binding protein [Deltaproteobacteria bacterium]